MLSGIVKLVADDGVADACEMDADLMRSAGLGMNFQESRL